MCLGSALALPPPPNPKRQTVLKGLLHVGAFRWLWLKIRYIDSGPLQIKAQIFIPKAQTSTFRSPETGASTTKGPEWASLALRTPRP